MACGTQVMHAGAHAAARRSAVGHGQLICSSWVCVQSGRLVNAWGGWHQERVAPACCIGATAPCTKCLTARPSPTPAGEGGNDLLHKRKQIAAQKLNRGNLALMGNIQVRAAPQAGRVGGSVVLCLRWHVVLWYSVSHCIISSALHGTVQCTNNTPPCPV